MKPTEPVDEGEESDENVSDPQKYFLEAWERTLQDVKEQVQEERQAAERTRLGRKRH